jgi:perosamine synthetase
MIPVNIPRVTQGDIDSVVASLKDGWISGEGPVVSEFESIVARTAGRKFGVAVSNGSDALDLAFRAIDLKPGDEVILPSFTIISCLAPILRMGLVPVFIDADSETWNMDIKALPRALTKKTKAILAVHIYGLAADMDPILKFANEHNLLVIEDSAEAHGLFYKGRPCGSMGDVSTFSFYANKNVTTGEGGMVLTDNEDLADRLRFLRNLTFRAERRFVHDELGWNMRLSSLQAALGTSQVKRLSQSVHRRRHIAAAYREAMEGIPGIKFQALSSHGDENGYWVVGMTLEGHENFSHASEVMSALAQAGVGTRPFFYPLHKQPLLGSGYEFKVIGDLAVSSHLGEKGFYVPNGLGMSDEQLAEAVAISHRVLAGVDR